ncbi:MAG: TIR domain-containing protein [Cyanobacteria bacterium P01_F01_bin.150]
MRDFFISYNRHDAQWAEWIAWVLEDAGYSLYIQAWDFRPGGNFVLDMQKAAAESKKTILVLSETYLMSAYTKPEWAAAFVDDPTSENRKLLPVRVKECQPEGLLKPLVYVDLVGQSEAEAKRQLLDMMQDRLKPTKAPTFPGTQPQLKPVAFPAESQSAELLSMENPFGHRGRIRDSQQFFGRKLLLKRIFDDLRRGSSLSLVGENQIGKSSILEMIVQWGPKELNWAPEQFVLLNLQRLRNEGDFFEALWCQLDIDPTLTGWRLDQALEEQKFVVCIDEIGRMVDNPKFTADARDLLKGFADGADAPLTLVIASSQPLAVLFNDDPNRSSPLAGLCGAPLPVEPFSQKDTEAFLKTLLKGNAVQFTEEEGAELYRLSQGHPAKLQAAAAQLYDQRKQQIGK